MDHKIVSSKDESANNDKAKPTIDDKTISIIKANNLLTKPILSSKDFSISIIELFTNLKLIVLIYKYHFYNPKI